jgi:hypothetical protein
MVGLEVLRHTEAELLSLSEDCYVMAFLTEFLRGIANTDSDTPHKSGSSKSLAVSALIEGAYDHFGIISNEDLIALRNSVRLRVVQELQVWCGPGLARIDGHHRAAVCFSRATHVCRTPSAKQQCGRPGKKACCSARSWWSCTGPFTTPS